MGDWEAVDWKRVLSRPMRAYLCLCPPLVLSRFTNECVVVDPSSVGKARGMHAETRTSQLSLFNLDLGRFGFLYDGVGRLFGRERERGGAAIEVMRVCVRPMPWLLLIVVVVEHYCWW